MKRKIRINYWSIKPIIGFGYWKDIYHKELIGIEGVMHNFILPFVRWQWGYLSIDEPDSKPIEKKDLGTKNEEGDICSKCENHPGWIFCGEGLGFIPCNHEM
jgi:hypothetical protein